MTEDRLNHY
nr:unnamed protein product [Callosobruchus chinensis]